MYIYLSYTGIALTYHDLTSGISIALLVNPDRKLNGLGAQSRAIPVKTDKKYRLNECMKCTMEQND